MLQIFLLSVILSKSLRPHLELYLCASALARRKLQLRSFGRWMVEKGCVSWFCWIFVVGILIFLTKVPDFGGIDSNEKRASSSLSWNDGEGGWEMRSLRSTFFSVAMSEGLVRLRSLNVAEQLMGVEFLYSLFLLYDERIWFGVSIRTWKIARMYKSCDVRTKRSMDAGNVYVYSLLQKRTCVRKIKVLYLKYRPVRKRDAFIFC